MNLDEPNKLKAVIELVGGEVSGATDGSEINYLSGQTPPTEAEIDTKLAEMQAEYDAQAYARDRETEYPSWQEQQDMQFHDAIDGTTTWQDAIQVIKDKYPKG